MTVSVGFSPCWAHTCGVGAAFPTQPTVFLSRLCCSLIHLLAGSSSIQ